jgi:hypothetical protein
MSKTATVHAQQMWEYQCLSRTTENYLLNDLNEAGGEGWELVSTQQHKNVKGAMVWTAFLKRPRVSARASDAERAAERAGPLEAAPPPAAQEEARTSRGFDLDSEFKLQEE